MPFDKLFPTFDIKNFSGDSESEFSIHLARNLCRYSFSVLWTISEEGLGCSLNYLGGKKVTSNNWHQIITSPIIDDDGEISVSIGRFASSTLINISFSIYAAAPIPELVIVNTNLDTRTVLKIPPGDQMKKIEKGDSWTDSMMIELPN